jgi:hypothetical protein
MNRIANNYDICIKKVSILRKNNNKEEWKEKRNTALPMHFLSQTISKQTKKTKTNSEDVE